jgi:predicted DCC family thiol-disulfide oxidoreductase YuxK
MSRFTAWFTRHYLSIDPRTLALTRVFLATLLLFDLVKRWLVFDLWYAEDGLLPVSALMAAPSRRFQFSFFYALPHSAEAKVGFALCLLAYLGLLVGYRTRLCQFLSLVAILSLNTRIDMLNNGGDYVLCILCWWTLFLPLGRRFSVDSLRSDAPDASTPVVSLAVLAALLQLSVIYFFNAVHKSGWTWSRGLSVYYVLQQERIIGPMGVWAREHLPLAVSKMMTRSTVWFEALLPILILSPVGKPWTRRLAIVLVWMLHLGIQVFANFGVFSPTMCVFALLLVTPEDWEALGRFVAARPGRARRAYYDASCGICTRFVTIVARMDTFGRLRFLPNSERDVPGVPAKTFDDSIVVVDERGRSWTGAVAIAELLGALPLARPLAWLARVPGLRQLAEALYQKVARHRTRLSAFFGLAACGLPAPAAVTATGGARAPYRRWLGLPREVVVALLMVVAGAQVLTENWSVPRWLKPSMSEAMVAAVSYTRLQQGWGMFAPEAPLSEMAIVVDAVTADGRHVDPLNERTARYSEPQSRRVPVFPNYDVFFTDYSMRIPGAGALHPVLRNWLLRYPRRTGNPADRIVSFDVYVVEQDSPAPGETQPTNLRDHLFLHYP